MLFQRHVITTVLALAHVWNVSLVAQQAEDAARALEQGNAAAAQQTLDAVLKRNPNDLLALMLEGVLLDSQKRYGEAEGFYQRALKIAPNSPQVLNNVGNHYVESGDRARARECFLKAVAADPKHVNANLQLARSSVEERQGRKALEYLDRIAAGQGADPNVLLLRARGLSLAGRCPEASDLARKLEAGTKGDSRIYFSTGMTFAECKAYDQAEKSFSVALTADPKNFDVLYNLGLAALRAGNAGRAAEVFEVALQDRPEDPDCLYALSQAYLSRKLPLYAAALLARAQKSSPGRADVVLLLAQVSADLGFYKDSIAAYERYLKLKPTDEVARRERAFALACAREPKAALPELEAWVRRHPRDATGLYELARAQAYDDRVKARASLDRALALSPSLVEARYSRAVLNIEGGTPAAAVEDLRVILGRQPDDDRVLTRLGQAYLALNRPGDAVEALKRAVELNPQSPGALILYRDALEKLGRKEEAAAILSRLKAPAPAAGRSEARGGLIGYLSLPPAEQRAQYLENLRKNSAAGQDPRWKLMLGTELLADGKTAEGLAALDELRSSGAEPTLLAEAGRALVEYEQYEPARRMLEQSLAVAPSSSAARLDLALALFHLASPDAALRELDKTPAADRKGDFYLLRAQILDALGWINEAADALNQGIREATTRPDLYFEAAGFLLKHRLYQDALRMLEQACRMLPDARELQLAQAVTLIHLKKTDEAQKLLATLQARWPEWERPYLLNGILLELLRKSEEARQALETAIALGANTAQAYYYQALAITHATPDDTESAQKAIARALALAKDDPYIDLLAGKIALSREDNPAAIRLLEEAVRLEPTLIPGRYALVSAYRATGDEAKSSAQLEEIKRLSREKTSEAGAEQKPFSVEEFLFTVRPAGAAESRR